MPQFYPSMFVNLTEILDTFGTLVFERIKTKSEEQSASQAGRGQPKVRVPADFVASDISSEAKETCRNWFYKTACIRELLPRLYIEISLLRCYRFLSDSEYPSLLKRLAHIIRGIGDPMVALYARCYLVRGGMAVYGRASGNSRGESKGKEES